MERRKEPEPLSKAIAKVIVARGLADQQSDQSLKKLWRDVAGDTIAGLTRVVRLRRGVLEIGVTNPAMLNELEGFRKQTLNEAMRKHSGNDVRELRFRLKRTR